MNSPLPSSKLAGIGVDIAVDRARPAITQRIQQTEAEHNLRVLFACESGSRAWGFASNDSDFDIRLIYVRPADQYVRLRPPVDAFDLDSDDDFDLAGWDIRKAAELMRKSNGPLFEWLDSPIVYFRDDEISPRLIELARTYFDPKKSVYHYLSLAGGVWKKHLLNEPQPVRKKYLYTLRPLACVSYIEKYRKQPPTEFLAVLNEIDLDADVRAAIDSLVEDKKANRELGRGAADQTLNQWITQRIQTGNELAAALPANEADNKALDELIAAAIFGNGVTR